jgi:hypothetical protein
MARRDLSLPVMDNSGVNPHRSGFRTIGQAITEGESRPVRNPSGWFIDRLNRR